MESNTSVGISTEESSLLILNDYCFINIFKLLQPFDFVNLARTCNRLQSIALDLSDKFKEMEDIELAVFKNTSNDEVTRSNENFSDILSVFGGHVRSITIFFGESDVVFEAIRDKCQKLNRLELDCVAILPSQHFSNLRELKIDGRFDISVDEFGKVFTSNPNIECLELQYQRNGYSTKMSTSELFKLLELLPKLKILELKTDFNVSDVLRSLLNLSRLPLLTKLSLPNLEKLLDADANFIELPTKSNLLELELDSLHSYNIRFIKLYKNLELLHLHNCRNILGTTVFPKKLKFLCFSGTSNSYREIIAIVKQLRFLEEFDLVNSKIWYLRRDEVGYYQHLIVSRIVEEIGDRNVKIIYPNVDKNADEPYLYNSNHLQIIRSRFLLPEKSRQRVRIPNVFVPV